MFVDTHCHLDDKKFQDINKVVASYLEVGVERVITIGCDNKSSLESKNLSENFSSVYFASGFHPSEADKFTLEGLEIIKNLCEHEKCVAVGEIGLDYHWEPFDLAKQKEIFEAQIQLANQYRLPISVHSRDATKDVLDILRATKPENCGVMHCFSGSKETAKILLDLGFYLGFGGTVTFNNATNLKEVASYCPLDRILTETDSPYLAPHPFRGSVNEPKNIPVIASCLAFLKGESLETIKNFVYQNAKRLFYKLK